MKQKISPESKKQKSMLHFVDCSKENITGSMAEMFDSQDLSLNQHTKEKSVIELKRDGILEKTKPIDEIRINMKALTDNVAKLENTAKEHGNRLTNIEVNAEANEKTLQSMKTDIQELD